MEKLNLVDGVGAGLVARPAAAEICEAIGRYRAECLDADGNVKWVEEFPNTVVDVGKRWMLDNALNASATSATNVYMGLKGTGTPSNADTMASHATWTELNISASSGARQSVSFSAASGNSKATSANVSFSITAAGSTTVYGVFVVLGSTAVTTNGSTAGTLFSAGDFSSSRSVVSGDTLNVSYSVSV